MKIGDVVQLASGGPIMTVVETRNNGGWDSVQRRQCQWFEGTQLKSATFPAAALRLANQSTPNQPIVT